MGTAIHIDRFQGANPRVASRLLGNAEAQIARNCRLWSGELTAWRKPLRIFPVGHNYLLWSNQFQQAGSWTQLGLNGITTNATTAPDGTLTADKLLESGSGSHRVRQSVTKTAVSEFWCGACSGKLSERNFMWVRVDDGTDSNYVEAIVNLTTGAITAQNAVAFTNIAVTVEAEANGFWRLHVVGKTNTTTSVRMSAGVSLDGTQVSYAGTLNSGIFIDGASLRKSNKAGPYRETLGAALPDDPTTIYGFRDTWLVFNEVANPVPAPLAADTVDSTYYTRASGEPRLTYSPIAEDTTGSGDRPRSSFSMGLPVPANPVAVVATSATGNITGAVSQIASVGAQVTQDYTLPGVVCDGRVVRAKFNFTVRISTGIAQNITVTFAIYRSGLTAPIALVENVYKFNPVPGSNEVKDITFTLEGDDAPPAGTYTYTADTTLVSASGGAFTPTYTHTGGHVRYKQTTVTSNGHGRIVGDVVQIANVGGMEAINTAGEEIVAVPTVNTYVIDVDSQGQTYTSGGTWTQVYDDEDVQDTAYVFTWLATVGGKVLEGPPSAPSNIIARGDGQTVQISSIDVIAPADGGSYNFSGKRIYRTNLRSDLGANYQFVAELVVGASSYNDSIRDIALGEVMPSTDWIKPPTTMRGLIEHTNGVLAAFDGKNVCFNEPYEPHAWPSKYRLACFSQPVALVGVGASIAVLTNGQPHFIHGTTPGSMEMVKIEAKQPCLSARGTVDMGYAGLYPGDDGLVSISAGDIQVVTRDLFTKEEWQAYAPTTFIAGEYDDRYVAFYTLPDGTRGGMVIDPKEQGAKLTFLDFGVSAAWTDPKTGDLYVLIDEWISKWDAATDFYDFQWRSKTFETGPFNPAWIRVDSTEYPLTVDIYSNPDPDQPEALSLVFSADITGARPQRLPGGYIGTLFELELRGNGEGRVKHVAIAAEVEDLY